MKGTLILCGPTEVSLARASFPEDCTITNDASTLMDLGKRVSRKKDYIPAITLAIKGGWKKPVKRGPSTVDLASLGKLEVDPLDPYQRVVRKGNVLESKKATTDEEPAKDEPLKVVG